MRFLISASWSASSFRKSCPFARDAAAFFFDFILPSCDMIWLIVDFDGETAVVIVVGFICPFSN